MLREIDSLLKICWSIQTLYLCYLNMNMCKFTSPQKFIAKRWN